MARKFTTLCAAALALTFAPACEREAGVQDELEDLTEARQGTKARVQEIQQELKSAKQRVVDLEKELALAQHGITDEVLEERQELAEALEEDRQQVSGEILEAKREAQKHNKATAEAEKVLKDTAPPDVTAGVESKSEVKAAEDKMSRAQQEERIVVEKVKGVETEKDEAKPEQAKPGQDQAEPGQAEPQEPKR